MAGIAATTTLLLVVMLAWSTHLGAAQCKSGQELCGRQQNVCTVKDVAYCCPGQFMQMRAKGDTIISCQCDNDGTMGSQCITTNNGNDAPITSASWMTCALASVVGVWVTLRNIMRP